jgi:hypothetical protein
MDGIDVMIKECGEEPGPGCCEHILESLEMSVLDGMAQWDDFDVYVDGTLVYSYDAVGGNPEDWNPHVIDLTPFQITCCGTHTIKIDCVNGPWEYFNPYGQLGVDTIALYCEEHVLCDMVDIGDPTSEAGHNLQGWGPIEPATNGGTWGGIDNCRATWFYTAGDQLPTTADASWATVDLTCEECYDPEPVEGCDCESPCMDLPFYMEPGDEVTFCICYHADILTAPGAYDITTKLVPTTV